MIDIAHLQDEFPFLSLITLSPNKDEYIGIIINQDEQTTSIYDYSLLHDIEMKKKFLELGEVWWFESNRKIPISIFLRNEMREFRDIIKHFNTKYVTLVFGPCVSLNAFSVKRVKRISMTVPQ